MIRFIAALLTLALALPSWATQLQNGMSPGPYDLSLLFEAREKTPNYERLFEKHPENTHKKSEFEKRRLHEKFKTTINTDLAKAKAVYHIQIAQQVSLGEYDFEYNGFPIDENISKLGFDPYFLRIVNKEYANFISVPLETIAPIEKELGTPGSWQRSAELIMDLVIANTTNPQTTRSKDIVVDAEIHQIKLIHRKTKKVLATYRIAQDG